MRTEGHKSSLPDAILLEGRHTAGVYAKRSLTIVRGAGASLWDEEGREYIDCVGGQGSANLGHAHPAVVAAITEQARILITCPETFYNSRRAQLLARLLAYAPVGFQRVYLCNSGTEAVEAALKFARFSTGRTGFVAAMRGFHGRTFGALSASWNRQYREPFEPLVPDFYHVPYNDLNALDQVMGPDTAGVILEVVQGEGGVRPGTATYLSGAEALCRERGALLIIDEVQTGFGRTGRMFAYQHHGLGPDLICLAKSIAGGIPMGAVLIGPRVADLSPGLHGSTFGGNPLACAAALATLEAIEVEGLVERAAVLGEDLLNELKTIESPLVREVRGIGLMVGIELRRKSAPYLNALAERGILALNAGSTVIRLLPPLVITRGQLGQVISALKEVLAE